MGRPSKGHLLACFMTQPLLHHSRGRLPAGRKGSHGADPALGEGTQGLLGAGLADVRSFLAISEMIRCVPAFSSAPCSVSVATWFSQSPATCGTHTCGHQWATSPAGTPGRGLGANKGVTWTPPWEVRHQRRPGSWAQTPTACRAGAGAESRAWGWVGEGGLWGEGAALEKGLEDRSGEGWERGRLGGGSMTVLRSRGRRPGPAGVLRGQGHCCGWQACG